jgi:LysR family glycine cleavage system transcriptional activator
VNVRTVAVFNDAGLMLQAAEQSLGLALAREIHAADALIDGRLVRLSPITVTHEEAQPYHLVYPPALRDWPPLDAFRRWLRDELDQSMAALHRSEATRGMKPSAPARKRRAAASRKP